MDTFDCKVCGKIMGKREYTAVLEDLKLCPQCYTKKTCSEKICKITNGLHQWYLEVDGHEIGFNGSEGAEYFKHHYRNLGYDVQMYKQTYTDMGLPEMLVRIG